MIYSTTRKKSFTENASGLKTCHVCLFATFLALLNNLKHNLLKFYINVS